MSLYFLALCFFIYGFLGWCTEVAFAACKTQKFVNRGFLNGPICPIYGVGVSAVILLLDPYQGNLLLLYLSSVVIVTVLEGLTGFAMDKIFHNKWWDYSNMPLNIGGYVCLLFSIVWGVACVLIVKVVHPVIFRGMEALPTWIGVLLIVLFGGALLADLYVTSAGIIKLNRRLASMERIAKELHEISDQLGEEIYKNTILAVEKQENLKDKTQEISREWKDKTQVASEEIRERVGLLKKRYAELSERKENRIGDRLLKAFPKMQSRNYGEHLEKMKEQLDLRRKK